MTRNQEILLAHLSLQTIFPAEASSHLQILSQPWFTVCPCRSGTPWYTQNSAGVGAGVGPVPGVGVAGHSGFIQHGLVGSRTILQLAAKFGYLGHLGNKVQCFVFTFNPKFIWEDSNKVYNKFVCVCIICYTDIIIKTLD